MKYKQVIKEIDVIPDFISDDYFNAQSLKNAVWQYMLDHSHLSHEGQTKITFFVPSEKEFWYRVKARETGKYKRNDLLKIQREEAKKSIKILKLKSIAEHYERQEKHHAKINEKMQQIRHGNNLWDRFVLAIGIFLIKNGNKIKFWILDM